MTRTPFPGAWYVDALPSGSFAVLIPQQHILTHLGIVPLPPGAPSSLGVLYLRITEVGGFRIAGQPHDRNDVIWEWTHATRTWATHPTNYVCVSPVIYSLTGELLINDGSWGSQGARYMNPANEVVTADASHGPTDGLSDWTDLGDGLRVGQGWAAGTDPAMVWNPIAKALRLLEPGPCTFIRAIRDGERVSLAYVVKGGAVIVQTTVGELLGLNRVPGPIVNVPEPEPEPEPTKEDRMEAKPLPADVHAIVVELHARHLTLAQGSDDDRRALQKKICETVRARKGSRWGWKSNHGVNIANAKDAIAQLPDGDSVKPGQRQPLYMWDLFNGGTREPNKLPIMSETEHVEQFFVPVDPIDHLGTAPAPPVERPPVQPPTQPPAPPVDLGPLTAELKALRQEVEDFKADLEALASRPVVDQAAVGAAVAAMLEGYEVNGKTRVGFGHQHDVKLAITRKA